MKPQSTSDTTDSELSKISAQPEGNTEKFLEQFKRFYNQKPHRGVA